MLQSRGASVTVMDELDRTPLDLQLRPEVFQKYSERLSWHVKYPFLIEITNSSIHYGPDVSLIIPFPVEVYLES